jgi:GNAT superfamily N-acetyltransferase
LSAIERITKQQLLEHLKLLDEETRRWRFGYAASNTAMEMYVNGIKENDYIFGIRESIASELVVASMHLSFNSDGAAEMGVSTLKDYRRRGYAERLMRYSVDILRNRNIRQLYSVCLPDNTPLLKMLQKLNIASIISNDGDKEAKVIIPMAGIDSILNEVRNERLVIIDNTMRPWAKLWEQMFYVNVNKN